MSGGLMQIVAQGAQDKHLTQDPEITFFKSMYRRHTNFAVESIEQTFNGHVTAGGKVSATISRNGDLVHRMWLEVHCQGTELGLAVNADDDSARVDSVYECIDNVSIEIGGTRVDRHYGPWMKIHDDLTCPSGKRSALDTCVNNAAASTVYVGAASAAHTGARYRIPLSFWFCKDVGQALPLIALQYHEVKVNVEFTDKLPLNAKTSLWVDYIYLDTAERQRFARNQHEYLIEQVQTTGDESLKAGSNKIRLNFNHPVKELVWKAPGLTKAKLELNGHDRFAERDAAYFSKVQQYQHHTNKSAEAYVYSFALEPEKLQPSGSCNFSRIDNASLQLTTTADAVGVVYAVNYNMLRIKSGMGGLAYSN